MHFETCIHYSQENIAIFLAAGRNSYEGVGVENKSS